MQNCTSQIKLKETWTIYFLQLYFSKAFQHSQSLIFFNGPMLTGTEHLQQSVYWQLEAMSLGERRECFRFPFCTKRSVRKVFQMPLRWASLSLLTPWPQTTMKSWMWISPHSPSLKKNRKEKNPSRSIISVRWNPFILMT